MTQKVYIKSEVPQMLLEPVTIPVIGSDTYGYFIKDYIPLLYSTIKECNIRIDAIREGLMDGCYSGSPCHKSE